MDGAGSSQVLVQSQGDNRDEQRETDEVSETPAEQDEHDDDDREQDDEERRGSDQSPSDTEDHRRRCMIDPGSSVARSHRRQTALGTGGPGGQTTQFIATGKAG